MGIMSKSVSFPLSSTIIVVLAVFLLAVQTNMVQGRETIANERNIRGRNRNLKLDGLILGDSYFIEEESFEVEEEDDEDEINVQEVRMTGDGSDIDETKNNLTKKRLPSLYNAMKARKSEVVVVNRQQ